MPSQLWCLLIALSRSSWDIPGFWYKWFFCGNLGILGIVFWDSWVWFKSSVCQASWDMSLEGEGVGATSLLQGEDGSSGPPPDLPWQPPSRDGDGPLSPPCEARPQHSLQQTHRGRVPLPPVGMEVPPRGFSAATPGSGLDWGISLEPSRLLPQPLLTGWAGTAAFSAVFGRIIAIIV